MPYQPPLVSSGLALPSTQIVPVYVAGESRTDSFSPLQIPGLAAWYAADRITGLSDGAPVTSWPDLSGNGRHATQATGSKQPLFKTVGLNGRRAVRLDGIDDVVATAAFTRTNPRYIFAAYQFAATGGNQSLFDGLSANTARFFHAPNASFQNVQAYQGSALNAGANPRSNTPYIASVLLNGGAGSTIRLNGVLKATGNTGASSGSGIQIGGSQTFYGDYYELIECSGPLSADLVARIERYMAQRHGVTLGLDPLSTPTTGMNGLIVFDGDSLTAGTGVSNGAQPMYPGQVMATLGPSTWTMVNCAVSGQQVSQMSADAATEIDVLKNAAYPKNILMCWGGTNDLFFGASAATTYSRIVSYCQARQAAGWKVVVFTILPRSGAGTPGTFNTDRATVNASIVANWATFADALVDVASDPNIGPDGASDNATYYADKIHCTAAGYAIVGGLAVTAIQSL